MTNQQLLQTVKGTKAFLIFGYIRTNTAAEIPLDVCNEILRFCDEVMRFIVDKSKFQKLQSGMALFSNTFNVHNLKFRLVLYPNQQKPLSMQILMNNIEKVSAYFHLYNAQT